MIILTAEKYGVVLKSIRRKIDMEEQLLKKAQEEQEERYQEKQKLRKQHEDQMREQVQRFRLEALATKSKQLQEERDLKTWETIQRFKRAESDEKYRDEERKKNWDKKMEYGNEIKKYIVSVRRC